MADCLKGSFFSVFFFLFLLLLFHPHVLQMFQLKKSAIRDGSGGASVVHERGSGGSLHPVEERRETV